MSWDPNSTGTKVFLTVCLFAAILSSFGLGVRVGSHCAVPIVTGERR